MHTTEPDNRLNTTWWALRLLFGVVPIAAGLDKFLNLLTDWTSYLNPIVTKLLPVAPGTFMHIVGVIEIAVGIVVLSRLTRVGAFLDVAVRDLGLAVAAFSLAQLTAIREESPARSRSTSPQALPVRS
jgi:uncharacterized membrane protein YphA (DoxX/SURF4 family)